MKISNHACQRRLFSCGTRLFQASCMYTDPDTLKECDFPAFRSVWMSGLLERAIYADRGFPRRRCIHTARMTIHTGCTNFPACLFSSDSPSRNRVPTPSRFCLMSALRLLTTICYLWMPFEVFRLSNFRTSCRQTFRSLFLSSNPTRSTANLARTAFTALKQLYSNPTAAAQRSLCNHSFQGQSICDCRFQRAES